MLTSQHLAPTPQRYLRGLACMALCLFLAACGFHLKGVSPLPFNTIYTNIDENSEFGSGLRRAIIASSPATRFVSDVTQAQARLTQLANTQSLREVSLDAQGRVEEYELNLEFVFQLTDDKGHVILPSTSLRSTREIPYDDSVVQAKQGEIATVFKEMQKSLIDRVVRRLSSPDVTHAFTNAESMPVDETPAAPQAAPAPQAPSNWGAPRVNPGAGAF
ncbi:MAG: LPS assembly lipoprotein LptE [Burkholderiaceae bacterium]